ncbi:hypothetical protein ACS0TY_013583 [Phlomoides rotata]
MLKRLIADHSPDVIFISESRICTRLTYNWKGVFGYVGCIRVDPCGTKGGLILFWNGNINVLLRSYSVGHIDALIFDESKKWRFTGCYGNPITHLHPPFMELVGKLY